MRVRCGFLFLFASALVFSQDEPRISIGVKGGAYLKDLFDSRQFSSFGSDRNIFQLSRFSYGDAREKRYLVGPSVEVRLPFRLSVELDALYSRLNGEINDPASSTVMPLYAATGNRWEFPLLAKYRIPAGHHVHPFVGVGPSFSLLAQESYRLQDSSTTAASGTGISRTSVTNNARNFGTGLTATGGVSFSYAHLQFTPEIRYTRREQSNFILPTSQDGVQALVGISFGR